MKYVFSALLVGLTFSQIALADSYAAFECRSKSIDLVIDAGATQPNKRIPGVPSDASDMTLKLNGVTVEAQILSSWIGSEAADIYLAISDKSGKSSGSTILIRSKAITHRRNSYSYSGGAMFLNLENDKKPLVEPTKCEWFYIPSDMNG